MKTPPFEALTFLQRRLESTGVKFALGGSGLLAHHGLVESVRDWDITTDGPWPKVESAIRDLDYVLVPPNGIFTTDYLCKIDLMEASIDLMGSFSILSPQGSYSIPTRITGAWNGFPVGCLLAWEKAYALMGRTEKSELIRKFMERAIAKDNELELTRHEP